MRVRPCHLVFLLVGIVGLLFSQIVTFPFLPLDDPQNIVHNEQLANFSLANLKAFWLNPFFNLYIPVSYTFWLGLAALSRVLGLDADNAMLFHAASVLLHASNSVLVFFFLRRLFRKAEEGISWSAFLGALLFAIHPIQVETIAWASCLRDLLGAFLSLGACHLFLKALSERKRLFHIWAFVAYALAVLAKPSFIVLPMFLMAIQYFYGDDKKKENLKNKFLILFSWLLFGLPIVFINKLQQPDAIFQFTHLEIQPWQRIFVFGDSIVFYLRILFWPFPLLLDYGRSSVAIVGDSTAFYTGTILLFLLFFIYSMRKLWPGLVRILAEGMFLFVIMLLPVSGLIWFEFQSFSSVADRYLYFPIISLSIICVNLEQRFKIIKFKRARWGLAACFVVLAGASFIQTARWADSEGLMRFTLRYNPSSYLIHQSLGVYHLQRREFDKALPEFYEARKANSNYFDPQFAIGKCLLGLGRPADAVKFYAEIFGKDLHFPEEREQLRRSILGNMMTDYGIALEQVGERQKAIEVYHRALEINPEIPLAIERLRQ